MGSGEESVARGHNSEAVMNTFANDVVAPQFVCYTHHRVLDNLNVLENRRVNSALTHASCKK